MTDKPPVTITDIAAEKLKQAITEEGKSIENSMLRVFVQGGGCSGFQYGLNLIDKTEYKSEDLKNSDIHYNIKGIKLVIDPISRTYLKDAEIDWQDNITGGTFIIKNPNAKSTCGCGQSFEPE